MSKPKGPHPAILLGVVAIVLWFTLRDANAGELPSKPDEQNDDDHAPTEPGVPKPAEPPADGYHPTPKPTQGQYYQVKSGDTLSKVVVRAGLPGRAHNVATAHPKNAWIHQIKQEDGTTTLKLWPRYIPAYKGEYQQRSTGSLPVVYVPTMAEWEGSKWAR